MRLRDVIKDEGLEREGLRESDGGLELLGVDQVNYGKGGSLKALLKEFVGGE